MAPRSVLLVLCAILTACAQPDLRQVRQDHVADELRQLQSRASAPAETLTLDRAIQIAIANNFEYALRRFETDIQQESATGAKLAMLPSLFNDAQYEWRDELRIASSESADSGTESLEPSFSSVRDQKTYNFELLWSLLDFGISYFRARQADNQVLVYEERARRAEQTLVLDVTRCYYRAIVADHATRESAGLVRRLTERQKVVEEQMARQVVNEIEGLASQETLVQIQMSFHEFQRELRKAKGELATLLGLAPGSDFTFPRIDFEAPPQSAGFDLAALEREALEKRPELWEEDLHELIASDEVRARIVSLCPNIAGFFGGHYDDNPFLRHQFWLTAGVRATWDLLSIPEKFSDLQRAWLSEDLVVHRRMALAMAIVSQVNLAVIDHVDALEQYSLARSLTQVRERRWDASRRFQAQGQLNEAQLLEAEADAVFARLRLVDAYADVAVAAQRVETSAGRGGPPRFATIDSWD